MSFVEKEIPRSGRASPYLDGRREWNERYGSHVAQARNWRLAAFAALGVAAVAVAGNVWQAGQARVQPFVVVVDQLGDQIAVGPVAASRRDDPRVVTAQLRRWIMDVRAVTTDHETTTRNINEAYAMTDKNGPALMARGILYAPDYVINAGGIINVSTEYLQDGDAEVVRSRIAGIPDRLEAIWSESVASGRDPASVADVMARKLIGRG